MKKLLSIIIILLLCLAMCSVLSGCEGPEVSVSSVLSIDDNFSGTRTVTVAYPLTVKIDSLKDVILADAPADVSGAAFRYVGVEEDGYIFELKLSFKNRTEYESVVSSLIGRGVSVFMSRKDTTLTKGTRLTEDFDVSDLIYWMVSDTAAGEDVKDIGFSFSENTVKIGSESFETGSTVNINECTGSAVNSISVKTTNDKAGGYSRTFAVSMPNSTYTENKTAIEEYFKGNTLPDAKYAGWSPEGSNMIYTVIYEELNIDEMTEVTAMLLDTDSCDIFYGDRNNSSTPLSEGLTFEEYLDTYSFITADNGFVPLYYSYSLPLNTTYGDGSVYEDGRWVSAGEWKNDLYTVELNNGSAKLRIPDGIQYSIEGIDFELASLGDSRFRRSTDFIYAKDTGSDAVAYAQSYFAGKGVDCEVNETDDSIVCHVAFEGSTEEITAQLVSVFGSGNFMAYVQHKGAFDLSIKTELTDYVNLGYMLNADNEDAPMTYTVSSDGGENIVSVSVDGSETVYADRGAGPMTVHKGCATVQYHGNIPVTRSIVIYLVSGSVLLLLTAFIAIRLIKPKKRREPDPLNEPGAVYDTVQPTESDTDTADEADDDKPKKTPLSQTTTFSIFELNTLVRNKKYVDEINKDVEARLHAQSLEEQKHDIRARELEDLSRKVYGDGGDPADDDDGAFADNIPEVSDAEDLGGDVPESSEPDEADDGGENDDQAGSI